MNTKKINVDGFFNSLFNEIANTPLNDVKHYLYGLNYSNLSNFPPVNIKLIQSKEEVDSFEGSKKIEWILEMPLCGFTKDEVSIEINHDLRQLLVKTHKEKTESEDDETKEVVLLGRFGQRNFQNKYSIPFHKIKEYKATLDNGLLTVRVKPEETNHTHKVEIE